MTEGRMDKVLLTESIRHLHQWQQSANYNGYYRVQGLVSWIFEQVGS